MITIEGLRKILVSVIKTDAPLQWADDFDFRVNAVDSLDMVNFVLRVEEASGLHIPDTDFDRIRTLADVLQVLEERRSSE